MINNLDIEFDNIIFGCGLHKTNNPFFINSSHRKKVDLNIAFNIASNWLEITKNFLFSSIKGIGILAEKIAHKPVQDVHSLLALQTIFTIISDDLGNARLDFKKWSPQGIKGIHYVWWEETIVKPLGALIGTSRSIIYPGVKKLTSEMWEASNSYLGVSVQLRIVEAIALDICEAFLSIFSNVYDRDKFVFCEKDLGWIHSHIKAESIHHEEVCNKASGMANIAITHEEQEQMLSLATSYSKAWADALKEFSLLI